MNASILLTIAGIDVVEGDNGQLSYVAGMQIDDDGSGDPHHDPDFQARTSYRNGGNWLNADLVPYIVLPPRVIRAVPGIVLGCQAQATNSLTGLSSPAVVGDVGPMDRLGEGSIALARAIGVDPSPTTGGEDRPIIRYLLFPGVAAVVNGITYQLQSLE